MISPQEKIQLMRQWEVNPAGAILTLADFLRRDSEKSIADRCAAMMAEMKKGMPDWQELVKAIKGEDGLDGDDASPEQVAAILLADKSFLAAVKGDQGIQGRPGEAKTGPRGAKGDKGDKPVVGVDFEAPRDGYTPKKGVDYFDGESVIGPPGKDGSPDKPEEIAAKLNLTEESVNFSVIRGLGRWMDGVKAALREKKSGGSGGGGMGNPQHQTFNVTSATSTCVLDNKVAANGYALWVHYEGAYLVRGTGYTVGADRKTLTLLFTPEDGPTHIDVVYIRS